MYLIINNQQDQILPHKKFILKNLTHTDTSIRKRCQYLLVKLLLQIFPQQTKEETKKSEKLVTIYEMLEENQAHIVKQIYGNLRFFVELGVADCQAQPGSKSIHFELIEPAFYRLLNYDNHRVSIDFMEWILPNLDPNHLMSNPYFVQLIFYNLKHQHYWTDLEAEIDWNNVTYPKISQFLDQFCQKLKITPTFVTEILFPLLSGNLLEKIEGGWSAISLSYILKSVSQFLLSGEDEKFYKLDILELKKIIYLALEHADSVIRLDLERQLFKILTKFCKIENLEIWNIIFYELGRSSSELLKSISLDWDQILDFLAKPGSETLGLELFVREKTADNKILVPEDFLTNLRNLAIGNLQNLANSSKKVYVNQEILVQNINFLLKYQAMNDSANYSKLLETTFPSNLRLKFLKNNHSRRNG